MYQADRLRQFFPASASVKAVIDGGLFFDVREHKSFTAQSEHVTATDINGYTLDDGNGDDDSHNGHAFRRQ